MMNQKIIPQLIRGIFSMYVNQDDEDLSNTASKSWPISENIGEFIISLI
jgi:hypothetical protein